MKPILGLFVIKIEPPQKNQFQIQNTKNNSNIILIPILYNNQQVL